MNIAEWIIDSYVFECLHNCNLNTFVNKISYQIYFCQRFTFLTKRESEHMAWNQILLKILRKITCMWLVCLRPSHRSNQFRLTCNIIYWIKTINVCVSRGMFSADFEYSIRICTLFFSAYTFLDCCTVNIHWKCFDRNSR